MNHFQPSGKIYHWMRRFNPGVIREYSKGIGPARVVLLLTTLGRKSGLPRVTPLQFEEIQGVVYIASARGEQADWYRNLQACPEVDVQIRQQKFHARAELITDCARKADFFAVRMRHNVFIRLLIHYEGLPFFYRRADLERFAAQKAVVALHPC